MQTPKPTTPGADQAGDLPAREAVARGIVQQLGVDPRAVAPYSGHAKTIERAFRTFGAEARAALAKVRP